jgi:acyl-ACP thioesterase
LATCTSMCVSTRRKWCTLNFRVDLNSEKN